MSKLELDDLPLCDAETERKIANNWQKRAFEQARSADLWQLTSVSIANELRNWKLLSFFLGACLVASFVFLVAR